MNLSRAASLVGRKRAKPVDAVLAKIERAGGQLEGSTGQIGDKLGLTKSSARRAIHALAAAGLVSLAASPAGTLVQMRRLIPRQSAG